MAAKQTIRVLFVCLGNICRSPLAEGIFKDLVAAENLSHKVEVDSCGTGDWHLGKPPHHGSQKVALANGISLADQRARQLKAEDLNSFDIVVAMDRENLKDIRRFKQSQATQLMLLRELDDEDTESLDVPDPYYTGTFDEVFAIIHRCSQRLLDKLKADLAGEG